jgi:hypothetical protein
VRVDEEVCAAAGGNGRAGGRLVAIFHYDAIFGRYAPRAALTWFGKTKVGELKHALPKKGGRRGACPRTRDLLWGEC